MRVAATKTQAQCDLVASLLLGLLALASGQHPNQQQQQPQPQVRNSSAQLAAAHLQPSQVYGARNRSINFTHLALDELTNSIYVGATDWLLQLALADLRPQVALRSGPAGEHPRDCAPADCPAPLAPVELGAVPLAWGPQLDTPARPNASARFLAPQQRARAGQQHNFNKILAVDADQRQLVVCGSLGQGACRRHQLGALANFSELVPVPVAANDELSSSVALVVGGARNRPALLYVAATNSRVGPYRELVPALAGRYLEEGARAMQIAERSFTDSARVDVSFELRDYYLINYVHAFQHAEFAYFAQVQRKSPLRQLEEWGYVSRLARLCLGDLSFQSYAELSLECGRDFNLLQDAALVPAGPQLARALQLRAPAHLLVGVFAQSRDHTTRTGARSAVCAFPMEAVERRFADNIAACFGQGGRQRARNMNYIAGSLNDCPKSGSAASAASSCSEPLKLNGSLALSAQPLATFDELLTAVAATLAPSSPISLSASADASARRLAAQSARQHQVLLLGTGAGALKRLLVLADERQPGELRALEFDSVQLADEPEPVLADLLLAPAAPAPNQDQFALAATPSRLVRLRVSGCRASGRPANGSAAERECRSCAALQDPYCGWCASASACLSRAECLARPGAVHWSPHDQIRCADYQPLVPARVPVQASAGQQVEVNLRASGLSGGQLAGAQLTCHFDYQALANRSAPLARASASTKAAQPRVSAHADALVVACPLPAPSLRPPAPPGLDHAPARVSLRLAGGREPELERLLAGQQVEAERRLDFYDCTRHSGCRACLGAGWSCAWCPLTGRCTFNASHPDFGCAASAVASISTTPQSAALNPVRGSHLTASLAEAQASLFGLALERPAQCPEGAPAAPEAPELLVAHGSRRALQLNLRQPPAAGKRARLECQLELEGAKMRLPARLAAGATVVCQESAFSYQEEVATQRGQLSVLLADPPSGPQQVIEATTVILYKCHLFGVSPPALTSSAGLDALSQHSSAAWRAHDFLALAAPRAGGLARRAAAASDCSLCANVERRYQCGWCAGRCLHLDQCAEPPAPTCPPPRIHSLHPAAGPLEGGTLLSIEGSNLGASEREIQDRVSVGGEPCQLVMYSVSTRIVCRTGASPRGAQAATVYVGNRAGVSSAHEKFHYKPVHLTDVSPRLGPVSGGTRLRLSGSNLNVGSRVQVFLDEIPCALDGEPESNQIFCLTAPNLLEANSMRVTRLTLLVDNSTHHLPYPFTYQPDPIITSIEPTESFVSGGRLLVVAGQHLAAPQSVRLVVFHEHQRNVINQTTCMTINDTVVTCLTPAISRDMIAALDQEQAPGASLSLSQDSAGLRLRLALLMDDVKSARNLDEYYHHLPHHIAYFEDPRLLPLASPVVEFADELVVRGENLRMRQLDQDILVTVGGSVCPLKSLAGDALTCEPPRTVEPVFDEAGRPVERPLLPVVALVGAHLRFPLGHMQYSASQFRAPLPGDPLAPDRQRARHPLEGELSAGAALLLALSVLGFVVGLGGALVFALNRWRQSKAEREYKRIQLQMGSLDAAGQPASLFDKIHFGGAAFEPQRLAYAGQAGKRLFGLAATPRPFHGGAPAAFPPSPQTDASSLADSSGGRRRAGPASGFEPAYQECGPGAPRPKPNPNPSSRAFNWTQEAPATVVPYALIEACNLTLAAKGAPAKEFV